MPRLTESQAKALIGNKDQYTEFKYPWNDWMDGNWWLIKKGEDYTSQTDSLRTGLLNRGRRHGMPVEVHKRGDTLLFKFTGTEEGTK
jgi:hypothetical protein